ncbi:MAG TPA: ABC transporter substrate-binding protein [Streptosporangiaceae bacterium]
MRLVPASARALGDRRLSGRRRALAGVAAAVAGLTVVAGCKVPGMSNGAAAPTVTGTINVGAAPGIGDVPLYLANHYGAFHRAGVTVNIVSYPSLKAELRDLQSGKIQVAFGDYADMFYAQAQAQAAGGKNALNMVILADGYDAAPNTMEVLTLPNSNIVTPKNLQGKLIGTTAPQLMPTSTPGQPYSLETVATQTVLQNENVDLSHVHWLALSTGPSLISALASHRVNAILATEPTIFEAESQLGAVPVLDSATGATANLPLGGYFALRSFAGKDHALLTAFRSALEEGQADASQQAPVRSALQGSVGMSVADASLVTLGQYPTSTNASDLQRVVSQMFVFNAIGSVGGNQLSVQNMIFH